MKDFKLFLVIHILYLSENSHNILLFMIEHIFNIFLKIIIIKKIQKDIKF